MLLTCAQMKAAEDAAFAAGVRAETLMDRAGAQIAQVVRQFIPVPGHAIAVCGKGNNAGDVLVALAHLAEAGWTIDIQTLFPPGDFSELAARKHAALAGTTTPRTLPSRLVLLDGLLGIGTHGAPRESVATGIRSINARRAQENAFVVAADIPSGLDGDTGAPGDPCVEADLTVTIAQPKTGLVADAAINFVGRLAVAPLAELVLPGDADPASLLTSATLDLPTRKFDSHKGVWGRVGIIAGSRGFFGAGRLCASGAIRAGGGLVTLYALPDAYEILAATCPPEVMVKPVNALVAALEDPLDALALGPGLGDAHDAEILEITRTFKGPAVIDADGLNALSRHPGDWQAFAGPRLFTPHPGEMERLLPGTKNLPRREIAGTFVAKHPLTLLLKGARTIIAERGRPPSFNTTGNPGMGSGGMGDVLTGVCAALLAQGCAPYEAAGLGAWVCGRAAERYVAANAPESLVASEVLAHLGGAFRDLREGAF